MLLKKILVSAAFCGTLFAAHTSAMAESLKDRVSNNGTVTVATEGTYAPFSFHDTSGKLTGYDVEVAEAVAKKAGFKIQFKETNWDSIMAGLKSGRFDMMANQVGLTTPERQANFAKSDAYSWDGLAAVAREDFDKDISKLEDIKGLKAAQTLSSNYGEEVRKAGAQIVPVDGMAQALLLVKQKRADITLNSYLGLLAFLNDHKSADYKIVWHSPDNEYIDSGLVVNKSDADALEPINKALKELKQEGVLKQLGEKYFGKDISDKPSRQ